MTNRVYAEPATTGTILGVGFATLFSRFFPLFFASVLAHAPILVYYLASDPIELIRPTGITWLFLIIDVVLSIALAGAIAAMVVGRLRGEDPGVFGALGRGLARLLPLIALAIIIAVIIGVPAFVLIFVGSLMGQAGVIIFGIGALILALVILARFWVAIPAVMMEEPGPLGAMETSASLTLGRRGGIFVAMLVAAVITFAIGWVSQQIMMGLTSVVVATCLQIGVSIVVGLIGFVLPAGAYYLLSAEQEARWHEEQERAKRRAADKAAGRPVHQAH